jgi:flagellar basal-body rod protein FlgF
MPKGVYAALSGAVAANVALEVTAQNLANASTAGYQRMRPLFREVLAQTQQDDAPPSPEVNRFAAAQGTVIDLTPGVMRSTGRPLDVALPERTFLAVSTPAGERYTRAGNIERTPTGTLRVAGGELLDEAGKPITVDAQASLSISAEGQVLADGNPVSRVRLVDFGEPSLLTPQGGALFAASADSGEARSTTGTLSVGTLEESNASPVNAMTDLISVSRMFESFERAIQAFRDADRKIVTVPQT